MSERKQVTASREANTDYLNQVLPIRESFDLIQRISRSEADWPPFILLTAL